MSNNKSYSRYFIILQPEGKENAIELDKLSSGYAKLEIKNDKFKITFYVQNLKKDKVPYSMLLICNRKEIKKLINLGEIIVDESGRAEVSYEYEAGNILGSGIPMDKVVGAAIVRIEEHTIQTVMDGFINAEQGEDYTSYSVFAKKTEHIVEEIKEERLEEESKFDEYEKNVEIFERPQDTGTEYPVGVIGRYFKNIAEGLEEVSKDISKEIKRCIWYKVPIKDKNDLIHPSDYDKYTIIYYPMYPNYNYIKKYGYYLFGYKCDELLRLKYIVFGIPGKKSIEDQPYAGKTGFVLWIPLVPGEEHLESEGYWLMFYDFNSRTIVIPITD